MKHQSKKIDYRYKSFVLKTYMHKYVGLLDKEMFLYNNEGIIGKHDLEKEYMELYNSYGSKFIKECRKINNASFKRVRRLKERISTYLSLGPCIFVTLTFNDETMAKYDEKQRRVLVSRFLKRCSDKYVANIDYGNDDKYSHREHYHALVLSDYISETWEGGFSWFEKIHLIDSEVCLAKYICKLCNHAIKESTKRACYIYSR